MGQRKRISSRYARSIRAADEKQLRSRGPLTERGIMNSRLTTWLLSFALAVLLLFGIIGIVLFDRMHAFF
jgi:hypothetical protein